MIDKSIFDRCHIQPSDCPRADRGIIELRDH
jgi:hypothetical protein